MPSPRLAVCVIPDGENTRKRSRMVHSLIAVGFFAVIAREIIFGGNTARPMYRSNAALAGDRHETCLRRKLRAACDALIELSIVSRHLWEQ